ncbi:Stk1 family PASTA domain-containing Ser/Thr kinase [Kocuria indica]|uniref:non-specific serine/threonine protein kinase n=1 Tax=Kocuria marina subsp. indica TaxID=1049583 RepID=A0A6N9R1V5_9MICC|nr:MULTISPECIES: Stk1 family PASTA domain-containing Ser/Thr kinase [Kocuria]MCT1615256.1 Stk1 family PASTA domain-containing Ser/Thr kinase [Kocuria marina]NDO78550.1 Stk1 family PASTA domain-containing Ser/Thr kinase [Kocuria indica]
MGTSGLPDLINDRYEVGEVIGRGGMATVHVGQDVRLGRRVAIKILRPELAADETFHERFQREAHAVASLNHHSIVAIYDTGEIRPQGPDGVLRPYIVMEYVPGRTLRELMHGPGVTPEQAIEYMLGIMDALSFSHRAGIVHRDIKPANVKVTPDGSVKVMDFGIARAVEDTQAALTQSQAVLGTAQYLSPEQARGAAVDPRSDLYSAACMLFEMLTGRAPFVGESSVAIAAQHVRDAPPAPSALNPQLPPAVDRFMERALAKDPRDRFADAGQMRRALRELGGQLPGNLGATQPIDVTHTVDSHTKTLPAVGAGAPAAAVTAAGRSEDAEPTVSAQYGPFDDDAAEDSAAAASPAPYERRRSRRSWVVPVVLLLVLALLGGGAVLGVRWWQDQQVEQVAQVSVPQVTGMDSTTAEYTLRDAGLNPTFTTQHSDSVPDKHVISMSPAAGTQVDQGSSVAVVVSEGPENVTVPNDLVGQSLDYARQSLQQAGLTAGPVSTANSATVPHNVVLSTDPGQGASVARDSAVKLQVSTGKVTVPDVVGRSRAEAEQALRADDVRLNYDVEVRETEDAETGTVLRQSAPAGSSVSQGSTITLTVARKVTPTPSPTPSPTDEDEPTAEPTTPAKPTDAAPEPTQPQPTSRPTASRGGDG